MVGADEVGHQSAVGAVGAGERRVRLEHRNRRELMTETAAIAGNWKRAFRAALGQEEIGWGRRRSRVKCFLEDRMGFACVVESRREHDRGTTGGWLESELVAQRVRRARGVAEVCGKADSRAHLGGEWVATDLAVVIGRGYVDVCFDGRNRRLERRVESDRGVVSTGGRVDDELGTGSNVVESGWPPAALQRVVHPRRALQLLPPFPHGPNGDSTSLVARRPRSAVGGTLRGERPPTDRHVDVTVGADEPRHVDVVAGEVGGGVEQVQQILAAKREMRCVRSIDMDGGKRVGSDDLAVKSAGHLPRCRHLIRVVRPLRRRLDDDDSGVAELAPPVAPARPLHDRRPGRALGDHRPCAQVDTGLDHLGGDDDESLPVLWSGEHPIECPVAIGLTEPGVEELDSGAIVGTRLSELLRCVLRGLDRVDHHNGECVVDVFAPYDLRDALFELRDVIEGGSDEALRCVESWSEVRIGPLVGTEGNGVRDGGSVDGGQRARIDRRRHPCGAMPGGHAQRVA